MAKFKILYCNNCECVTEQICKGNVPKSQDDKLFDTFATAMTLEGYLVAEKLLTKRKKYFKCTDCGGLRIA